MNRAVAVCGAGGFIGGHLVDRLLKAGYPVRAVDVKPLGQWWQVHLAAQNRQLDLREKVACREAVMNTDLVFNLAADMGGIGFIEENKALCMLSVLINTHLLLAARDAGVGRYFFASSACVYAEDKQRTSCSEPLKESDAYPAMPEDGYGWEKLFSERMCRHFMEDFGLEVRVARYHNVYGPHGTWTGGREKAPAAICRKVIQAKMNGERVIEIWGDGTQRRTFMYIDDCIRGTLDLMGSDVREPVNLGSEEVVTIDQIVDIAEDLAGVKLLRRYRLDAPLGVGFRASDNSAYRKHLGWAPDTPLRIGLEKTYRWIHDQITSGARL